jgi:CheY-like chemotaxis protein
MISVRDNGMGIPAEMLPRVFDMFAQVDRSLKRSQGGLGIGLTLAKNLVQMHGGQIEVRSEGLGKGSEFVIRLPLPAKSDSLTSTPTKPITHKPLPVRRILVVDDTHAAVFILGRLLEALGQQVRTANSGAAALEVVQQERPDVIISDIAMPGMDGYELAGRLRKEPGLENVVLVALTGYSQDSDRQRARTAGFNYHLVKPVSMEALQDLLGSLPLAAQTGVSGSRA